MKRFRSVYSDDEFEWFFDVHSVKYVELDNATAIDVWIKMEYTDFGVENYYNERKKLNLSVEGFENLSYQLEHWYISDDCYATLQSISYDIDGSIIDDTEYEDAEWEALVPESIGESVAAAINDYINEEAEDIEYV